MDSRKTVVILMLPYRSHYRASFDYANFLKSQGKRVIYLGSETIRDIVVNEKFEFHAMYHLFDREMTNVKSFLGILIRCVSDPCFKIRNYRTFYSSYLEIKKFMKRYNPAEIYLDEGYSEYCWFFREFKAVIKLLNPNLSTTKVPGVPPLDSPYVPQVSWWSDVLCEFLWSMNFVKLKSIEFINRIAFLGHDELTFWKRFCSKRGWNWEQGIEWNHSFYRCMTGIETIILGPKALEFARKTRIATETYFHQRTHKSEVKYLTDAYLNFMSALERRFRDPKFRLIYYTFGTQGELNHKRENKLLIKLMECIRHEPNMFLVISDADPEHQKFNYANIRILSFVPHKHFLPYADIVISHGDICVIKDCLDESVPMIIYPLSLVGASASYANRIQALGLGLAGSIDVCTPKSIRQNIYDLVHEKRFINSKLLTAAHASLHKVLRHA
ncbi:MAG: hypothetical protein ABIS36_11130 [Chryseolinea sp.]